MNTNIPITQGFDEFMNVVVDEAAEVYVKGAKPRRELGM
jgi:small nuclear ribonucleoprotein E